MPAHDTFASTTRVNVHWPVKKGSGINETVVYVTDTWVAVAPGAVSPAGTAKGCAGTVTVKTLVGQLVPMFGNDRSSAQT